MDLIFVHGALVRDGAWWWQPTVELLRQRTGLTSRAMHLPSCAEGAALGSAGLVEDAAALRRRLDELDDAIVVGHSYGGTVVAEAGAHVAVRHLVLTSSYLPDVGVAQADIVGGEPDPVSVAPGEHGTLSLTGYDERTFGDRFLQDADAAARSGGWRRVTAQSVAAFGTPTSAAGWQGVETTYLVCTEDRSTSLELQRHHADRATRSVELPTGHHPFISRPDLVADQVQRILAG